MSGRVAKKKIDDDALRRLWPTGLPDKHLEERLGHHRGVLRRRAAALGLPPRVQARIEDYEMRAKRATEPRP